LLVALVLSAAAFVALPGVAVAAEPCPLFDGGMSFPNINGSEDLEEFCWEVHLEEGQELRPMSETEAKVFYEGGHEAFTIEAAAAHDAIGAEVPTTLAVTDPNLITLTVHHRAGNPAAGGAPFDYPVIQGAGWEGGFQSVEIKMPPTQQSKAPPSAAEESRAPPCEVPALQGRSLKAARRALLRANCILGPVRGARHRGAKVVKQYRPAYKTLPAGTAVGVKLGL
jgi:hypothetical protein